MNFTPEFYIPGIKPSVADVKRLEPITQYMTTHLITFNSEQDIGEVIDSMLRFQISGAPVLNEDQELVGLISEKDCLRALLCNTYHNDPYRSCKVKDYMARNVMTISAGANVIDVANMFVKTSFRRFPVVEDGRLLGWVNRHDILKAAWKLRNCT